jgi:hypothetical protein
MDFTNQAMLFGAGLLVSLLPLVILLSAFASQRVDDDISIRLGLDRQAAAIVDQLFTSSPASLNAATISSLVFLIAGVIAVASSLRQIYEKTFHQDHRGVRDLFRLVTWVVMLAAVIIVESLVERPVSAAAASGWLDATGYGLDHDTVLLVDDALLALGPGPLAHVASVGRCHRDLFRSARHILEVLFLGNDRRRQQNVRNNRRGFRHHDLVHRHWRRDYRRGRSGRRLGGTECRSRVGGSVIGVQENWIPVLDKGADAFEAIGMDR